MALKTLNKICFTICIVCIVAGTAISLGMIWGDMADDEGIWKIWGTILVLFLSSAMTMLVSRILGGVLKDD